MSILKMKPYYSEKIWGYEKWNLSTHRAGSSIIEESGQSLADYRKSQLPILIKIIKSEQSLSVQVHPGDEFARKYENMGRFKRAIEEYKAAYDIDSRDEALKEKIAELEKECRNC